MLFARGVIGNVRKVQEDSFAYELGTPNGDFFVVCDGMGGHAGGETASKTAVKSMIEVVGEKRFNNPKEALNSALQYANASIFALAESNPQLKGMGTTACAVLVRDKDIWIAHVGDSRIYIYLGKERELHRLTKDHSYVQSLVDAGEITEEEAEHHPNKNRITKALGIRAELDPTFNYNDRPIIAKNLDIIMICSDGLSGMISDCTIERVLGGKKTIIEKGEELIRLAMEGETVRPGGLDNCTLELIEIDNSPHKKSYFKSYSPDSVKNRERENNRIRAIFNNRRGLILFGLVVLVLLFAVIWWFSIGYQNYQTRRIKNELDKVEQSIVIQKQNLDEAHRRGDGETGEIKQNKMVLQNLEMKRDSLKNIYDTLIKEERTSLDAQ